MILNHPNKESLILQWEVNTNLSLARLIKIQLTENQGIKLLKNNNTKNHLILKIQEKKIHCLRE